MSGQNQNNEYQNDEYVNSVYLKGLGGWLIFITIELLWSIASDGYRILAKLIPSYYELLLIPSNFSVDEKIFFLNIVISKIAMLGLLWLFTAYLICLYFKKSYKFPKHYIIWSLASFVITLIDFYIHFGLINKESVMKTEDKVTIVFLIIGCAIWILYMLKSVRVKRTFVNGKPITNIDNVVTS